MNAANHQPPLEDGKEPSYHAGMDRRLTVLETRFDTILPTLATKADIESLRGEFRSEMEKLRGEFRSEMEKLRGEFRSEMEKLRADLFKALNDAMRWMMGIAITIFAISRMEAQHSSAQAKASGAPVARVPAESVPRQPEKPATTGN